MEAMLYTCRVAKKTTYERDDHAGGSTTEVVVRVEVMQPGRAPGPQFALTMDADAAEQFRVGQQYLMTLEPLEAP